MPVVHVPAMASQMPSNVKSEPVDSGGFGGYTSFGPASNAPPPVRHPKPKPAHQALPKQPPPPANPTKPSPENVKDPVDIASIRCQFGWATIDGVSVPYLLREGKNYVAVRIVEQKLLARFPNTFPEELGEHEPLVSYYITQNELKLLDEINSVHCNYDYGNHSFTGKDLIVKLQEFEAFYNLVKKTFPQEVLEARRAGVPLPPPAELAASKSGWIQVNNTVTPYFRRGIVKYVVLQIIKHAAKLLQNVEVQSIFPDEEEYKMINDMCKQAGLEFQFAKKTKLVSLEDVKLHHKVTLMELPTEAPMKYAQYNAKQDQGNSQAPKSANMACSVQPGKPAPQQVQQQPQHQPQPVQTATTVPPVHQGIRYSAPDLPSRMPLNVPMPPKAMVPGQYRADSRPVRPVGGHYPMNYAPAMRQSVRNVLRQRPPIPQQFPPYRSQMRMQGLTSVNQRHPNHPPPPYYGGPNTTVTQRTRLPNAENLNQVSRFQGLLNSGNPNAGNPDCFAQRTNSLTNHHPRNISSQPNPVNQGSVSGVQPHRLPNAMFPTSVHNVRPQTTPKQSQNNGISMVSQQQNRSQSTVTASVMSAAQQNMMANQAQMFPALLQGMMRPQVSPQMQMVSAQNGQIRGTVSQSLPSQQMQIVSAQRPPTMMNTPNQTVGNQQATHFVIPIFNQCPSGNNSMPRMNNILQRPPFQMQQGQILAGQGMQMQGRSQHISQENVMPVGPTQNIQTTAAPLRAPAVSLSSQINQPGMSLASVPSKELAQPLPSPTTVQLPNPTVSTPTSSPSLSHKERAKTWSPPVQPPDLSSNNSDKSPTVTQTRSDAQALPNAEMETEALEVVKISKCVTGVRFQERSISCLEYEHLKGKHALVEAVCKLYFPQCKINEFLFVLEQVLKVPTVACQPNEEKAFIHYYHLPVTVLKCNKMVKLDDLSKYYPQLSYMFAKSKTNPASQRSSNKEVDNQDSGVVFVEETAQKGHNTPAGKGTAPSQEETTQNIRPDRPVSGGKRKHISGPGQPSKQLKRLEDTVERLKQNSNAREAMDSPKPTPASVTEASVIVIE